MRFRHLFRNVYGFELEWQRIKPLLGRAPGVWDTFQKDVNTFLAFLDAEGLASN